MAVFSEAINVLKGQKETWDEQRGFGKPWIARIANLSHVVIQFLFGLCGAYGGNK